MRLVFVAVCLAGANRVVAADGDAKPSRPFISIKEGLASDSRWLNPGKLDFLYRGREADHTYNAFAWTPTFKGGGGFIAPETGTDRKSVV